MPEKTTTRRLAAIMFTDIVGYTALMEQDEGRAAAVRSRHRAVFDRAHERHGGTIVQYYGDGTLSVFQSGVEAVECAVAIQTELNSGDRVPLRIGLHLGDIVFDATDIYGDGVNVASRIESMGVAGGILLSGPLNRELRSHPHLATASLGHFEFKNVAEPIEVFSVTCPGVNVPARADLRGQQKRPAKSIAVLPFVNMSADPENEYFSDGMTEEIINALTKIRDLKVTSRTSSFYFKNKNLPIARIGRELNVSIVLEGSIRLAGSKMRITAQLIEAAADFHFWSETFDRPVDDIFAVQDEISVLIAEKLREHLGHFEIEDHLVEAPGIPVDAYKRYLKSRYHLLKMSKADLDLGLDLARQIVAEQPGFALAYLAVNLGYSLLGTIGLMPAGEAFVLGKPFLDRAIELAPDLPECQLHLSWNSFLNEWDFDGAYRHLNRALEIRPSVDFYQSMACVLAAEGKYAAALHYLDTAVQLDPFAEINYHLQGFVFYLREAFEPAIEFFEKSVGLHHNFSISILYWGQALIGLGRPAEALAFFQKLPDDAPGDVLKLGGTTLAYAALGDVPRAEAGIAALEAFLPTDLRERATNLLILGQAVLGRQEAVLQTIERAIDERLPLLVYLPNEPLLRPFRSLPRFRELMRQILGERTAYELSPGKYKKSLLDPADLPARKGRLEQLMLDEKPYLDPDLTLRALAEKVGLTPNQLSQLLNEGFDRNFAEFVNGYRLEAFKTRVADPAARQLTILGLAYESGFNSKTVFNTYFRKMTGQTPKGYWKTVVKA
jgi:adenylate cyclase